MDTFFDNAQRLFDTAASDCDNAGAGEATDFAVLIRPDGGLHFVMETPLTLDAAAQAEGARAGYRVSRSSAGVRVEGMDGSRRCVLEREAPVRKHEFLRDAPSYRITSPLLISGASELTGAAVASRMYLA